MHGEQADKSGVYALTAEAQTGGRSILVVGTETFIQDVQLQLMPWNLQFVRAYPNPFRGYLKLRYTLPVGIQEVRFTLYDLRGRSLWKGVENHNCHKGSHILLFDGKTGTLNKAFISSGMYIMRMNAINQDGKDLYGGEQKITCLR